MSEGLGGVSTGKKGGREWVQEERWTWRRKLRPDRGHLVSHQGSTMYQALGQAWSTEEEWKRIAVHFTGIYSEDFLLVN